jgi:molybdopterin molybdotransferase
MISVQQALQLIKSNCKPTSNIITLKVPQALACVLAQDILSPITMPPFRQSAMDGYAVHLHDEKTYTIIGEIQAGDDKKPILNPGEAVRIFTGAPVPDTANAVVIQEKVHLQNQKITVEENPQMLANIRPIGEQIKKGEQALSKGTKLHAAAIGFLASLGITEVLVYKKPTIAVVATGNELVKPGEPLSYGQIYESNALMLASALKKSGFEDIEMYHLKDNFEQTFQKIKELSQTFDFILMSGGISVGDYDFIGKTMQSLAVEQIFYKVKQKPGKPLFFGVKNNKYFFGLPGNPASSLSCFYNYVIPALELFQGNCICELPKLVATITHDFIKKGDRAQFLKAFFKEGKVTILEGQASSMLHTFARANALVFLPEEANIVKINQEVEVVLLPF